MYTENTKFSPTIVMLIDFGRIQEIQEYPHHFELQVIDCSNFSN